MKSSCTLAAARPIALTGNGFVITVSAEAVIVNQPTIPAPHDAIQRVWCLGALPKAINRSLYHVFAHIKGAWVGITK